VIEIELLGEGVIFHVTAMAHRAVARGFGEGAGARLRKLLRRGCAYMN